MLSHGCFSLSQVQQSSFYGYTGMLPKRYTQGVMTGESEYLPTPGGGAGLPGLFLGTPHAVPQHKAWLLSAGPAWLEMATFVM